MVKSEFHGVELLFRKAYKGSTIEAIQKIEDTYSFFFPELIKEFYLNFNEGQLDGEQSYYNDSIHLEALLEINEGGLLDFGRRYTITLGNEYWPTKLVPFGYDAAGDDFCFSVAPDDYGAIYFHNSEWTGEPEEIQFLSKDFLSFLAALRPESDFE